MKNSRLRIASGWRVACCRLAVAIRIAVRTTSAATETGRASPAAKRPTSTLRPPSAADCRLPAMGGLLLLAACCLLTAGCASRPDKSSWWNLPSLGWPSLPALNSPFARPQQGSAQKEVSDAPVPSEPSDPPKPPQEKPAAMASAMGLTRPSSPAPQKGKPAPDYGLALKEKPAPGYSQEPKQKPGPDYSQELNRGRDLEQSGKYAQAQEVYQRLLAEHPDRYEAYHRLGVIADCQRRYTQAEAYYSQAIQLNNRDPDLCNDLGYSFYQQGRLERARTALLEAVALNPSQRQYRNNLGTVYAHLGRRKEALEQFRLAGSEADAYCNLAVILASQGDVQEAQNHLQLALAADPAQQRARQALKSLESGQQDPAGPSGVQASVASAPPGQQNSAARPGEQASPVLVSGDAQNSGGRPDRSATAKDTARQVSYQEKTGNNAGAPQGVPLDVAEDEEAAAARARPSNEALLQRARTFLQVRQ